MERKLRIQLLLNSYTISQKGSKVAQCAPHLLIDITCRSLVSSTGCSGGRIFTSVYSHSCYTQAIVGRVITENDFLILCLTIRYLRCCQGSSLSSLFLLECSPIDFTLRSRKWTVNHNNKVPAPSEFSLGHICVRIVHWPSSCKKLQGESVSNFPLYFILWL